jgi:hypothetical protein
MTTSYSGFSCNGNILPSVTTILSSDDKHIARRKSAGIGKSKANLNKANDGRVRGLSIHQSVNQYLLTGEADVDPKYLPYWNGLYEQLQHLDLHKIYFAERPQLPELSHLANGDYACVWSDKYKFAGIPDLVANVGGVNCVIDFKTSTNLFTKYYDRRNFREYHQWHSYANSAAQVAAYGQAFQEQTGIKIDAGIVINTTPDTSQLFVIDGDEMKSRFKKFITLTNKFHKHHNYG